MVVPPRAETGDWYESVLKRGDAAEALSFAMQATPEAVPNAAAFADGQLGDALAGYARDRRTGARHAVFPAAIPSTTVGSMSLMCDAGILDPDSTGSLWDNIGYGEQYRVGTFDDGRFMGEFTVFVDTTYPPISELTVGDGTYTLAEQAALVLLWHHFGGGVFEYAVIGLDGAPGDWVVGHGWKKTLAVFLGDCRADRTSPSLDKAAETIVKPGQVMSEAATVKAMHRIADRFSQYD